MSAHDTDEPPQWVSVTLDVPVQRVREWDRIEVGGRMEKVESVTVLHNGRRLNFVRGGRLTLSTGRVLTVRRIVDGRRTEEPPHGSRGA
ncbi:hypothetical protein [Streptomyces harbinensis]|uniref:hypothetical protein n=1 Tax=Streptomyces harbinensis TaxID=1176198 RepID=UPI0034DF30B1